MVLLSRPGWVKRFGWQVAFSAILLKAQKGDEPVTGLILGTLEPGQISLNAPLNIIVE
jgi:hypothetical protein